MKTQSFTSYRGTQPRSQQLITHPCDVPDQCDDDPPKIQPFGLLRGYFHGAHST